MNRHFAISSHQGKHDLLDRLPDRLSGYKRWLPPDWRVVVLCDRDDDDCIQLKQRMEAIARRAGLMTKTRSGPRPWSVVTRLAIEELEAWYFGDWDAVRCAYSRVSPSIPRQAAYREPDAIAGGTWEAFERVLRRAGYFSTGLRKGEAANEIAPHMSPSANRSPSFQRFRSVVEDLV